MKSLLNTTLLALLLVIGFAGSVGEVCLAEEKPLEAVAADTAAAEAAKLAEEAKAERLFKAQEAFDKLSPTAKTDRRLRALEHVLAAKGFDRDDQVALEKPGERTGLVDPRSLREPPPATINVNGRDIEVGKRGTVVANVVLVKLAPQSNEPTKTGDQRNKRERLVAGFKSVAGIREVSAVFKNAPTTPASG